MRHPCLPGSAVSGPVKDLVDTRARYDQFLAGALELRDLPQGIDGAYRAAHDADHARRLPMLARIREAQIEAHRLMLAAA